jgi:hypothetical protein
MRISGAAAVRWDVGGGSRPCCRAPTTFPPGRMRVHEDPQSTAGSSAARGSHSNDAATSGPQRGLTTADPPPYLRATLRPSRAAAQHSVLMLGCALQAGRPAGRQGGSALPYEAVLAEGRSAPLHQRHTCWMWTYCMCPSVQVQPEGAGGVPT